MISAGGYSAFQFVFGPNPVNLYERDDQDEDLLFAQDTPVSAQFAQQWKLRMVAQSPVLKGVANSTLGRLLEYGKTSNCTDVKIGDSSLLY